MESKAVLRGRDERDGASVTVHVTHAVTAVVRLPPASSEEGERCGAVVAKWWEWRGVGVVV
jgi:hypothetical protein